MTGSPAVSTASTEPPSHGPWTRATLMLVRDHPGVVSTELTAKVDRSIGLTVAAWGVLNGTVRLSEG